MQAYFSGNYVYLTGFVFALLVSLWFATIAIGPRLRRRQRYQVALKRRLAELRND